MRQPLVREVQSRSIEVQVQQEVAARQKLLQLEDTADQASVAEVAANPELKKAMAAGALAVLLGQRK